MTAKDFLEDNHFHIILDIKDTGLYPEDIENAMIGFAKLHVEAALKVASKKTKLKRVNNFWCSGEAINKDSILTAYPLDNIK